MQWHLEYKWRDGSDTEKTDREARIAEKEANVEGGENRGAKYHWGKEVKKSAIQSRGEKEQRSDKVFFFFFFALSHFGQAHPEETTQTDGKTRASFFFEEGEKTGREVVFAISN